MDAKDKLIVALDVDTVEKANEMIELLSPAVSVFKVGSQLFTVAGPQIIHQIHEAGAKVFLDLKFYDIPNTVARVAEVATDLGVFMFNVHASGGMEMMKIAKEASVKRALEKGKPAPVMIAVTVLTSFNEVSLKESLGVERKVQVQVKHYAKLAQEAQLDGVVASAHEIELIRQTCGKEFVIVTPGIRPLSADKGDQKRVMTPKQAIQAGSHYLVIGRPILAAASPVEAAQTILAEIS